MPHTAALIERERDGQPDDSATGALADVVDLHRYRQMAVQTRHPGLSEPTRTAPACNRCRSCRARPKLCGISSPGRLPLPCHRLVAQPSGGAAQRCHGLQFTTNRPRTAGTALAHRPRMIHRSGWRASWRNCGSIPMNSCPSRSVPFIPQGPRDRPGQRPARRLGDEDSGRMQHRPRRATWLMEHEPWIFMGVYTDAIDHFCHGFMKYHPPRRDHIPEKTTSCITAWWRRLPLSRPDARRHAPLGAIRHHCHHMLRPRLSSRSPPTGADSQRTGRTGGGTPRPGHADHGGTGLKQDALIHGPTCWTSPPPS